MSGHNYSEPCPNCGENMQSSSDHKPVSYVDHQCLHCGLLIYPRLDYMELEELNFHREEHEMDQLKELPKQTPNIF